MLCPILEKVIAFSCIQQPTDLALKTVKCYLLPLGILVLYYAVLLIVLENKVDVWKLVWHLSVSGKSEICCRIKYHPASERLGTQTAGRGRSLDSRAQLTKGASQTIWCRAQQEKLGKNKEGGDVKAFFFPSNYNMWWLNICLSVASSESIPYFALLAHAALLYLLICCYLKTLSPVLIGAWASGCVGLSDYWS